MTPRVRKWFVLLASPPLTIVAAATLALWLTLPPARSTLHLAALSAPVDVTLDRWGIPRIHAATEADAAAALGYLHARDRMFQMELMRRQASGRLAEIAGARAVPLDRMARIFGERRHAEQSLAGLPPALHTILESYSAGVNAWIAERGRLAAPEFLVLGAPEPWTPVDSLLWSETVSLWLSDNFRTELARAALKGKIAPRADTGTLAADGRHHRRPTAPCPPSDRAYSMRCPAFPAPFTWPAQASNAWGRRWPAYCHRIAAAGGRPASGAGLPEPLVSGAHRNAVRRAGGCDGTWRAVPGDRPQQPDCLEFHQHRHRHPGCVR